MNAEAGWCRVDGLLTADDIVEVLRACDELRSLPAEERSVGDKPHAGTHHLVQLDHRCAVVAEVVQRSRLLEAVAAFIGESTEMLQVSYRSPQPGFGGQRLHADGLAKMQVGPDSLATAIVPLVAFTATNGSTRVVPGSHQRPDLQRVSGQLEAHADEVQLTGPPGCAFVFSGHLLHSGTRNDSQQERPALQLQWQRVA